MHCVINCNMIFLTDSSGDSHRLCLASYRFPKGCVPKALAHGNSKTRAPFHPTWPSTMQKMKADCCDHGPKETVSHVSSVMGGMESASAPGKLPRDEHQVSNMRHSQKKLSSSTSGADDELFVVMTRCKCSDGTGQFVRDVKAAPDPAVVLATDSQLHDLSKFSTNPEEFCIVTVDPTFNLGDFEVTPITYRHLLLVSLRSGKSPLLLGPVLVHYRKDFRTFLYFASTLVGLCPQLERLQAFGTDGETALIDAMAHEFGFATHLLCAIHLRRNIKQKLLDLNFPVEHRRKILDEIFGGRRGSVYLEGLIDAKSAEDFDLKLAAFKPVWDQRECDQLGSTSVAHFHDWFLAYKAEDFKTSAISPVRELCGLGSPPDAFTTNASETINSVLKSKVDYKKSDLHKFIDKLRSVVDDQQHELERAVCRRGKFRFRSEYQYLEVDEGKWFNLTPERRHQHLQKVRQTTLAASGDVSSAVGEQQSTTPCSSRAPCCSSSRPSEVIEDRPVTSTNRDEVEQVLSVAVDSFSNDVITPRPVLDGIWTKAAQLLSVPHKIVPAPGCDALSRMVESKSGSRPHLVSPGKGGKFSCDNDCLNFKSFGICSHCVAVAEFHCRLSAFVDSFKKTKKVPNMTALGLGGMPKGRGRKGTLPPRKKAKMTIPEARIPLSTPALQREPQVPHISISQSQSSSAAGLQSPPYLPAQPIPCQNAAAFGNSQSVTAFGNGHNITTFGAGVHVSQTPTMQQQLYSAAGNSGSATPFTPFKLHLISGNIARCAGCKGSYVKPALPPNNLCIQHKEWRQVTFANASTPSSIFSNTYYHLSTQCVRRNWPNFHPQQLLIPPDLSSTLQPQHWVLLQSALGLSLSGTS